MGNMRTCTCTCMLARRSESALRRTANDSAGTSNWSSTALGVALDKVSDPPRLCGTTEPPLDGPGDVRLLYGTLATRNTATKHADERHLVPRSHCFAFGTLRVRLPGEAARTLTLAYPSPSPNPNPSPI